MAVYNGVNPMHACMHACRLCHFSLTADNVWVDERTIFLLELYPQPTPDKPIPRIVFVLRRRRNAFRVRGMPAGQPQYTGLVGLVANAAMLACSCPPQ
eukprot:357392-Chlamydomonas_euryale.AAC.41